MNDGQFQAMVMLEGGQTATSKPFVSTDEASHWASTYAEEAASKANDEPYSAKVAASLHSEATVDTPAQD